MAAIVAPAAASASSGVAVMTAGVSDAASSEPNGDANGASNGREARNLAEKQRRDKLNASIQELATMVPHAAESTRRLDKTAVLRLATHGLRMEYVFGKSATRRRRKHNLKMLPSTHETPQLTDTLMQLLDSFLLTLTCNGQIVLVSGSVEQLLGHCQSDLYGQNLLQITHPDDQALLRQQLIPRDIETLFYQQQQQQQQQQPQQRQRQQQHQHQRRHKQRRQKSRHSQSHSTSASDEEEHEEDEDEANDDDEEHEEQQYDNDDGDGDDDDVELMDNIDAHMPHRSRTRPRTRTPSPETLAHWAAIDERLRADRRCFNVRLSRAATRAESTRQYEWVKIDGCFRRSDSSVTGGAAANYPIVSQLIRRSRNNNMLAVAAAAAAAAAASSDNSSSSSSPSLPPPCLPQHDAIAQAALHGISGNDIVLVAMGRIMRESSTNLSLLCRQPEPYQLEYRTRHLIDGSIIDCDQRIGIVAGYMKDEVRNLSPFSFMHLDDVRWVIVALRQMYDCNSDYGESCYRLLSRNGHFIYLHSKGFLEIDKSSNKVHSFLCVNTLLDEQAGKRKVQEMKNKFSTIIKADIPTQTSPDLPASRAPQQLERIVLYLIENLQKTANNGSNGIDDNIDAMDDGCCSSPASTLTLEEQAPSPAAQLALVPPAPGHVKHSISKSVDVVNVTSARNLQYQQKQQQQQLQQQQKQQQQQQQQQQQKVQQQQSVIRQLSCSESSTLSPASASSVETTLDDGNNSNASPPPATGTAATATAATTVVAPRVSVLKRLMSTPIKSGGTSAAGTQSRVATAAAGGGTGKGTGTQLKAALSSTLRSLDTQLVTMGEEARTLFQQQLRQRDAMLPRFEQQMDAIMLEHEVQKQLLVNITSEYETQVSVITNNKQKQKQSSESNSNSSNSGSNSN